MKPIRIEISPGELIDRITILELKVEHLADASRRKRVDTELAGLVALRADTIADSPALRDLSAALAGVNRELWEVEDELRLCERRQDFGERFVSLARSVYRLNDRRSELKASIDTGCGDRAHTDEKVYAGAVPRK